MARGGAPTRIKKGTLAATLSTTSFLRAHVKPGKQALAEPEKVLPDPPTFITDSIALDDEAYAGIENNVHRWDYWLGTADQALGIVGVEVHPAKPGEVKGIIKKKEWAQAKADSELRGGKRAVRAWYWISTGKTALSPMTTEHRQMVKAGILLVGHRLRLPP